MTEKRRKRQTRRVQKKRKTYSMNGGWRTPKRRRGRTPVKKSVKVIRMLI
jgi:hypothetical protein